jgi:hypothetical protein
MAALAVPTGINVLGEYGAGISIRYDEISRDFGGGYDETELVGPTGGLLLLRLKYGFLDASGTLTVQDPENGNAVTKWSVYVWKVFKRRKLDGAAMDVTYIDPETEMTATAKFKFVDSQLDYETVTYLLYSTGILLRQFIPLA